MAVRLHDDVDFLGRIVVRDARRELRIDFQETVERRRVLQPRRLGLERVETRLCAAVGPDDVAVARDVLHRRDALRRQRIEPGLLDRPDELDHLQAGAERGVQRKRRAVRSARRAAYRTDARRIAECPRRSSTSTSGDAVASSRVVDLVEREAAVVLQQLHARLVAKRKHFAVRMLSCNGPTSSELSRPNGQASSKRRRCRSRRRRLLQQ